MQNQTKFAGGITASLYKNKIVAIASGTDRAAVVERVLVMVGAAEQAEVRRKLGAVVEGRAEVNAEGFLFGEHTGSGYLQVAPCEVQA